MTDTKIKIILQQLRDLDDQLQIIKLDKEKAIDGVLTPEIKSQLDDIETEFSPLEDSIRETIGVLESQVKELTVKHGKSVSGAYTVVFNRGRVTWNSKQLNKLAQTNSDVASCRKEGLPYASIRRG